MFGSHAPHRPVSRFKPSPLFGQYAPTTNACGSSATTTRPSPVNSSISNGSIHVFSGSRLVNRAVPEYPSFFVEQFHTRCG